MPSQDLLFPILPRAPSTPSPDDIKREVTQISQKHQCARLVPTTAAAPSTTNRIIPRPSVISQRCRMMITSRIRTIRSISSSERIISPAFVALLA